MLHRISDRHITFASLGFSVFALSIGLTTFLRNWEYSETGHGWLLLAFCISSALLFFFLRLRQKSLAIMIVIMLVVIQTYAVKKFDWQRQYMENALTGKRFLAEDYIDKYPTFEEQLQARYLGQPNWVDFTNDCLIPLNQGLKTDNRCLNLSSVSTYYHLDLNAALNDYYQRMRNTARRISNGELKTKTELQQCIAQKQCALVPLLPPDVQAASIGPASTEFLIIRKAFWSLVNDDRLKPEVCEYSLLCKAMVQMGFLSASDPNPR